MPSRISEFFFFPLLEALGDFYPTFTVKAGSVPGGETQKGRASFMTDSP